MKRYLLHLTACFIFIAFYFKYLYIASPTPAPIFGVQVRLNEKQETKRFVRVFNKTEQQQLSYAQHFAPIAVAEMQKYGIPASISLAQGILESRSGTSKLAKSNNNHFGIKCFSRSCKKGHCSNFTDDSHKDFFRKYTSNWESYRAHSEYLATNRRYKTLFKETTYQNWAHGLQNAGYATEKMYAGLLIEIIENLGLDRYDK